MRVWRSLVLATALSLAAGPLAMATEQKPSAAPATPAAASGTAPASTTPAPEMSGSMAAKFGAFIPKAPAKPSLPFPFNRTFVAVTYKDQAFKDDRPTFRLSKENRGSGWSACNNWSATLIARGDQRMAVGPVAVTKRTCEERLMHNEQVFLFVLRTAQTWNFDGRTLSVNGPYGEMTFEPAV
jgi:heat shock protein HslJ